MRYTINKEVKHAVRNKYAWPGGYPYYLVSCDGCPLCIDCARHDWATIAHDTVKGWRTSWDIAGADINWEVEALCCENCGKCIESAYGEAE